MFCPKCGKEMPDTAMFCGNCGYKFEKSENKKRISVKAKKLVIILAVLGCCVCLPILVYFSLFHIPTSDWRYEIYGKEAYITGYNGKESEIVIPKKVKRGWISYKVKGIGWKAFYGCSNLTSIEIPEGVKEIGWKAFYGCNNLISIEIPNSVKKIGSKAFYGCNNLTSIEIPEGVTGIGWEAFYGCNNLISIEIPEGVKEIDGKAFYGCSNLISIEIPNSVKKIGSKAFAWCDSLTSIKIPNSVAEIEDDAFKGSGIERQDIGLE